MISPCVYNIHMNLTKMFLFTKSKRTAQIVKCGEKHWNLFFEIKIKKEHSVSLIYRVSMHIKIYLPSSRQYRFHSILYFSYRVFKGNCLDFIFGLSFIFETEMKTVLDWAWFFHCTENTCIFHLIRSYLILSLITYAIAYWYFR